MRADIYPDPGPKLSNGRGSSVFFVVKGQNSVKGSIQLRRVILWVNIDMVFNITFLDSKEVFGSWVLDTRFKINVCLRDFIQIMVQYPGAVAIPIQDENRIAFRILTDPLGHRHKDIVILGRRVPLLGLFQEQDAGPDARVRLKGIFMQRNNTRQLASIQEPFSVGLITDII